MHKRTTLSSAAGLLAFCASVFAAPNDADLAAQARMGLFRTTNQDELTALRANAAAKIAQLAKNTPTTQVEVFLTFKSGLTADQLEALAVRRGIDVTRAQAKAVVGSDDVFTFDIGGSELDTLPGSLTERLDKIIGNTRYESFKRYSQLKGEDRDRALALSFVEPKFYGLQGYTTAAPAAAAANDSEVASARASEGVDAATKALKEYRGKFSIKRASLASIRGAGIGSGDTRVVARVADGSLRLEASTQSIDPPPASGPAVTGDQNIDNWLNASNSSQVSGASNMGTGYGGYKISIPGQPVTSPPTDVFKCGSGVTGENNCPNDTAWAPGPFKPTLGSWMGGTDAWGVGLRQVGGLYYVVYCYIYLDTENDTYVWRERCDIYEQYSPMMTYGASLTRIAWNKTTVNVNGQTSYRAIAAFTRSDLQNCSIGSGGGCGGANSVFVPNAGVEDKLDIPNPLCNKTLYRTDDASDRQAGCFVTDRVISNLVPFYRDTTYFDSEDTFTPSAGFTNPAGIQVTKTYVTDIRFSTLGWESIPAGELIKHRVSITSRVNNNVACLNNNNADEWCYFNTDNRILSQRPFVAF